MLGRLLGEAGLGISCQTGLVVVLVLHKPGGLQGFPWVGMLALLWDPS